MGNRSMSDMGHGSPRPTLPATMSPCRPGVCPSTAMASWSLSSSSCFHRSVGFIGLGSLSVGTATDFCRVCGPVTGAGALPGDRDGDVDAEHLGEDCCGQVGGELEQCGGPGSSAMDAELVEAFGQAEGAEGTSWPAAGEQPRRSAWIADGGVALAGGGEVADEPGEWFGEKDRFAAQAEANLGVGGVEVAEGEADDAADGLGVEEHEQPSDAVLGFDGV